MIGIEPDDVSVVCVCAADIRMTNVPDIRISYRHETLMSELEFVQS